MTFQNLSEKRHSNLVCNLKRADEEVQFWIVRAAGYMNTGAYRSEVSNWRERAQAATPETGQQIFKEAWRLCLRIENSLRYK